MMALDRRLPGVRNLGSTGMSMKLNSSRMCRYFKMNQMQQMWFELKAHRISWESLRMEQTTGLLLWQQYNSWSVTWSIVNRILPLVADRKNIDRHLSTTRADDNRLWQVKFFSTTKSTWWIMCSAVLIPHSMTSSGFSISKINCVAKDFRLQMKPAFDTLKIHIPKASQVERKKHNDKSFEWRIFENQYICFYWQFFPTKLKKKI